LPHAEKLVAGGQVWGDIFIGFQTSNEWTPDVNPTINEIDWYLTFFSFAES
jgi:hypothetical protein